MSGNVLRLKKTREIALGFEARVGAGLEEEDAETFVISSGVFDVIDKLGAKGVISGKALTVLTGSKKTEGTILAAETTSLGAGEFTVEYEITLSTGQAVIVLEKLIIKDTEGTATVP